MTFICCVFLTLALGACENSPPIPPDTPRYTAAEAKAAIFAEVKLQRTLTFGCNSQAIHYRGHGIWQCGEHWTFDEQTGRAILRR